MKKIKDCSSIQDNFAADWLGGASCADKAVRDRSPELAAPFSVGMLKKRELWCFLH